MNAQLRERIYFLINPHSGGGRAVEVIQDLKRYAVSQQNFVEVAEFSPDRIEAQIAKAQAADIAIIGGGDGTVSTLLPMLEGGKSRIGILPLGTGNDLARELGLLHQIPWKDTQRLIEFFRLSPCREVTRFKVEYGENYSSQATFVNYISFGFDAKVVTKFAELRQSVRQCAPWHYLKSVWANRIGYAGVAISCLGHRVVGKPSFTIINSTSSTTLTSAKSLIFTNIRSMMGLATSNQHSSIFDDKVECIAIDNIFHYFAMLLHYQWPLICPRLLGSASSWELINLPPGVFVQIDGEPRGDLTAQNYRICPAGKKTMIVGKDCP